MAYLSQQELKSMNFKSIGKNVKISNKASIYNNNKIEIGDNSRIDDFCVVSGKTKIGRNVHIAPHCLVAGGALSSDRKRWIASNKSFLFRTQSLAKEFKKRYF